MRVVRFRLAMSDRKATWAFLKDVVSARSSLRAMREISDFMTLATLGICRDSYLELLTSRAHIVSETHSSSPEG
jgi:hypothetical protein